MDEAKKNESDQNEKCLVVGLTGGLASGKSTAAEMFFALGARIIDADKIAHDLLTGDVRIKKAVIDLFGEEIVRDGDILRKKLADKVFSSKKDLEALCNLLHPEIISKIKEQIDRNVEDIVVVDAPLLIESGLNVSMDVVIVVASSKEKQFENAARRGISREAAENILQNQISILEKIKSADYVIENNENLCDMKKGVDEIWKKLKEKTKNWI
ncbi:MAG: dephospho-CoA kinase [Candidatus Omnitrophica bacterium]|nr:dephospho-CoA kinase [Candidatus Omnitrophota bacterium]